MTKTADPMAAGSNHSLEIAGRSVKQLLDEIVALYKSDSRPWVIGYSGGKDSTAILRLVYEALLCVQPSPEKPVFVVSSDTLVETPVVVNLITGTLEAVERSARELHKLPISTQLVQPNIKQTFWANLLGRGYPAPTKSFRWCTERMKIDPISEFILDKVAKYGEVICVLGSRSSESASRAQVMKKHRIVGSRLARHSTLLNAFVYTPIEDWLTDDVWEYLYSSPAPWGDDHAALIKLYKDSNAGECPLVIDKSTPSCGNSRFGCWVCTVVTKDKSMDNLIEAGAKWLIPLQSVRNELYRTTLPENKKEIRSPKRRTGKVSPVIRDSKTEYIPGPYLMSYRKKLLKELLEAQKEVQKHDPALELITVGELHEIQNLWISDPNEPDWEESVVSIYREVLGRELNPPESDAGAFTKLDAELLFELQQKHGIPSALIMKLIELEVSLDGLSKRANIFDRIKQIFSQDWGTTEEAMATFEDAHQRKSLLDEQEEELIALYKAVGHKESHAA